MYFLKILKSVLLWRAWLSPFFFAMAIFFELAMGAIFKIEPSQARISLFVGFFMLVGVGFFLFSKNRLGNKVGGIVVTAILSAVFLGLKFYYF